MSRQACQLICILSQAMGSQFDSLAVQLLPALFKVLVITVQVQRSHPSCASLHVPVKVVLERAPVSQPKHILLPLSTWRPRVRSGATTGW